MDALVGGMAMTRLALLLAGGLVAGCQRSPLLVETTTQKIEKLMVEAEQVFTQRGFELGRLAAQCELDPESCAKVPYRLLEEIDQRKKEQTP